MHTRSLSVAEYHACFDEPMRDVTATAETIVDIWPYVDAIDPASIDGLKPGDVERVIRDAGNRWDHVLIVTDRAEAYVVVIVEIASATVLGHHFLDLAKLYGLDTDQA